MVWTCEATRPNQVARRAMDLTVDGKRLRGRPKARYQDTVRKDMEVAGLQDGDELDRVTWKAKTRKADSAQKREKR